MSEHFTGLTPAEAERLAMLAEEAGEIVQAATKILQHGYESHHPDGGPSNRELLRREISDLEAVSWMMFMAGDISPTNNQEASAARLRKRRYAHHQQ